MSTQRHAPPNGMRKPRADALRSIERIEAAAERLLQTTGAALAMDDVAREAGVGSATLYRHFPSRMHLLEHLYRDRMTVVAGRADYLAELHPPVEALKLWLHELVDFATEARDVLFILLAEGLEETDVDSNAVWGYHLLVAAVTRLLPPAQRAGSIRSDISVEDFVRLYAGIIQASEMPPFIHAAKDRRRLALALLDVMLDGMTHPFRKCPCPT